MDQVGILPYERILCTNATNGTRFETYAIPGDRGGRDIILNGAAAYMGEPDDRITIMSFTELDAADAKSWKPRILVLGKDNTRSCGTAVIRPATL